MVFGPIISTKLPFSAFQRLVRLVNHHIIIDFQCSDGQCFARQGRKERLVKPNGKSRIKVIGGNDKWFDAKPRGKDIPTIRVIMKDGKIYKNTL